MAVKVLMIDESVSARDVLRSHLECLGFAVVAEAENTTQGLNLFRTVKPALVTLDIGVPQGGGIPALALFRLMRRLRPEMPILVSSAIAFPERFEPFLTEGAFDFAIKPLTFENFERVRARLMLLQPPLVDGRPHRQPGLQASDCAHPT